MKEKLKNFLDKQQMDGISVDMDALEKVIDHVDCLTAFVKEHKSIYIYGTGAWGKVTARLLDELEYPYRGFVISDDVPEQEAEEMMSHPVIRLSQLSVTGKPGIIIGMHRTNDIFSVIRNLQEKKIYSYYIFAEKLFTEQMYGENHFVKPRTEDIRFSVLMPVYNVDISYLRLAVESVLTQEYTNWELCIVDDASDDAELKAYLKTLADDRIKIVFLDENGGISAATNRAAKIASGDYFVLMDNDDLIAKDALLEFYYKIQETDADILYSDQDIIDEGNRHSQPLFKPDWSPDLLLAQMYVGHLLGFRRELFESAGGFRSEFDGSQDYDLMLRMAAKTDKIAHVAKILYSWRSHSQSTATNAGAKPYSQIAGQKAVQQYLDVTYGKNRMLAKETDHYFVYDVVYPLDQAVLISIIIPTKDHWQDLKKAVDSIYARSTYPEFEIILLNNSSEEKETYRYFDELQKCHKNVKVVEAFYEFNWSKLCNHGIRESKGDVLVMLNNDVEVLSEDWLERLASNALREEIGVVGGLLLYGDGTIQHAGVLAGFGGWADHIYKGMQPVHYGTPFISPMVARNVTAVTGACMAFQRKLLETTGYFNEEFVICGSDIAFCIQAVKAGFRNLYLPTVRLTHYESKSRSGIKIPPIDEKLGFDLYAPYREHGDPYYNRNLDYNKYEPTVKRDDMLANFVQSETDARKSTHKKKPAIDVQIGELKEIRFRKQDCRRKRINLVLPSICEQDVFGGIATALRFFEKLVKKSGYDARIVITDREPDQYAIDKYEERYRFVNWFVDDAESRYQIVSFKASSGKTLAVRDHDYFLVTAWWTAHYIQEEYKRWDDQKLKKQVILYLIQDYEPGFYPWSTQYLLADATYRPGLRQIAIFNSSQLMEFMKRKGFYFEKFYYFEPRLNRQLKTILETRGKYLQKKKQVVIYGRPNTPRNAFTLIVESLKRWCAKQEDIHEWKILSAGEQHENVSLGRGVVLESVGKLSLEGYAGMLSDSYAGISLMVSPHPSYPPLEMAAFGIQVITNSYANKNLEAFSRNITSLEEATPENIGECLYAICSKYKERKEVHMEELGDYCKDSEEFGFIDDLISKMNE